VLALASVVGAVTTLLVATPAHASDVHGTRALSGRTVSFTAHAAAGGKTSSLSNPLDITCDMVVGNPALESAGFISADTIVGCHFDATGAPASVQNILISDSLRLNGALVDFDGPSIPNVSAWIASVNSQSCSLGNWANTGQVSITWPAGYTPAVSTSPALTTFFVPSYCPVPVPGVTGMTESQASSAITAVGLVPNPHRSRVCIDPGRVYSQTPDGGTMKPPGSTVNIFVDTGTVKGCVIK
jgi:hypothetical protein